MKHRHRCKCGSKCSKKKWYNSYLAQGVLLAGWIIVIIGTVLAYSLRKAKPKVIYPRAAAEIHVVEGK